ASLAANRASKPGVRRQASSRGGGAHSPHCGDQVGTERRPPPQVGSGLRRALWHRDLVDVGYLPAVAVGAWTPVLRRSIRPIPLACLTASPARWSRVSLSG